MKQNKSEDGGSSGGVIQKTVASFQREKLQNDILETNQLISLQTQ